MINAFSEGGEGWWSEFAERRQKLIKLLGSLAGERCDLAAAVLEKVDEGEYVREKVVYRSEPGELVLAYVLVPKRLKKPAAAVVCLHQHAGEYGLGKSEVVGLGGNLEQHYGLELVRRGYVTIVADSKCFEERVGRRLVGMDYERYEAMKELLYGGSLARRMVWDIMREVDYLMTREEVDSGRIGCIGHSMGGTQAWLAMALDDRIKVGVCSCGVSSYKAILRDEIIHCFLWYIPGLLNYMDVPEIVSLIAPRAFLILSGAEDSIFPKDGVEEVFNKAKVVYEGLGVPERLGCVIFGGGHKFDEEMRERAYEWLRRWL